ncbi:MAG: MurR/RpiR family transcriptional regulator [Atopobiaceae bacterium]|nr:MurR/RpiR family transcriptional regulator [Atopobiaceae bacterium]
MAILDALAAAKGFTDTERTLAAYVLTHADEVVRMRLATLAKESHTSNATVVRLCKKVGSAGYSEFRVDLSQDMERRRNNVSRIDANAPILENQGAPVIMSSIATLTREAINDCYAFVQNESIERAAELISGARHVITYAIGDTYLTTEAFSNLMAKIGITCISAFNNADVTTMTNIAHPDDVGLFVSYSGNLAYDLGLQRDALRRRHCKTIVVTANDELAGGVAGFDCAVLVPCRESTNGREKVATFYSQTCMRYVLECIYGVVFAQSYQSSKRHKTLAEHVRN